MAILVKTFENDTDFVICVFNCVSAYAVTIYDTICGAHQRAKICSSKEEALQYAQNLNNQYVEP